MLDVYCPRHRSTVLLWPTNLDGIDVSDAGSIVDWHCHCGHRGTTLVARRGSPREVS